VPGATPITPRARHRAACEAPATSGATVGIQFVGHWYEGRKPGFVVVDISGLLVGPMS